MNEEMEGLVKKKVMEMCAKDYKEMRMKITVDTEMELEKIQMKRVELMANYKEKSLEIQSSGSGMVDKLSI